MRDFLTEEQTGKVLNVIRAKQYFRTHKSTFTKPLSKRARSIVERFQPVDAIEWTDEGRTYYVELTVFETLDFVIIKPIVERNGKPAVAYSVEMALRRAACNRSLFDGLEVS